MTDIVKKTSLLKGLTLRILALVLIPALLLGAGMIWKSLQTTDMIVASLHGLSEKSEDVIEIQNKIQRALVASNKLVMSTSSLSNAQQIGLLRNNAKALKQNEKLLDTLKTSEAAYIKTISSLASLRDIAMASGDKVVKQKFSYVSRSAVSIEKLLEEAMASHKRTIKLVHSGRIDKAKVNYMFEERFRMTAAIDRLSRTSQMLTDVSTAIQAKASDDFNALQRVTITDSIATGRTLILAVSAALLIIIAGAMTTSIYTIAGPLKAAVHALSELANGQLDVKLPKSNINEIGYLSQSMDVFKTNMLETKKREEASAKEQAESEERQRAIMNDIANRFEQSVGSIVHSVSSGANQQRSAAESMSHSVSDMSGQSNSVMETANEANTTIQTIASAAEELSLSVQEIGRQSNSSADKAVEASFATKETVEEVTRLANTAKTIGSIVNLIQDIAGQTNLLALNATIEAARAGEAGKGFSVVASEVKSLASQTEKATARISEQIAAIQSGTTASMAAMESTSHIIKDLSAIAGSIAEAVKEQARATDEIAQNVNVFAESNKNVTQNIVAISDATGLVSNSASEVLGSADELTSTAEKLSLEVSEFLTTVRTG